ncbi:MAG: glucosaminidase domain-containing protein [Alphaproteobacteria bacterium]|nr:glucosaminidase domain-containing protein [Alphaproteobacteria bacterium]MDA8005804.1 glucosaminidase domain-containing protein [Alphaproteobacteria bacterium]MDA8013217.1 glucosaminidase domain-containing protein [Alphaproteobacteria bacterium]
MSLSPTYESDSGRSRLRMRRALYRRLARGPAPVASGYRACASLAIILLLSLLAQGVLRSEGGPLARPGVQYRGEPLAELSSDANGGLKAFFYRGISLSSLDYLGPPPPDLATIEERLAAIGYDWNALQDGLEVPRHFVQRLPDGMASADGDRRKRLFVRLVLPLILEVNEETLALRERLLALDARAPLSEEDAAWLTAMAERYRVKDEDVRIRIARLRERVNVIPADLVLAQAAVESGWGSSRFALEGNALFGQRGSSGRYLVAERAEGVRVQAFHSLADSVRAYFDNLNGHPSYEEFRSLRAALEAGGDELSAMVLLPTLENYAAAEGYAEKLGVVIESNGFSALRDLDLEPAPAG